MTPRRAAGALGPRARVAAWASGALSASSRRLHLGGGSVIGGRVGLLIDPGLLTTLAVGRDVALVTGTNGKTTTTRLLAAALGGPERVATSEAGANLPAGLVQALSASAPGSPAVLEVDEGYLTTVSRSVRPKVVTLLNLSRDQLDRVSEVRMVAGRWRAALAGTTATVVANADDPLVVFGAGDAPRVVWVAAGQLWRQDAVGCPACSGRITFGAEGSGGEWWCSCGFRRPVPDAVLVGDVLERAGGDALPISLLLPGRCNRANAAMAAMAATVLGVDAAAALAAMAGVRDVEGRFASVDVGDVRVRLLLAKNPAGWAELLDLLEGSDTPVVIGINARIADGHDPSWLWDVAFERLAGRVVVATGERCRDLAVRLRHAGVAHRTVPDELDALRAPGTDSVEYAGNYTAFQALRRRLGPVTTRAAGTTVPARRRRPVDAVHRGPGVPVPVVAGTDAAGTGSARETAGAARPGRAGTGASALRVVVVHPDLLGTYGDGGNGQVLAGRAAWRGIDVELIHAPSDVALPVGADIYCLGGGEDGPQVQSAQRLRDGALARAVDGGAAVLAVCAGFQVVGSSFPGPDGRPHPGVGLIDVDSVKGTGRRAVGELVAEPLSAAAADGGPDPVSLQALTGFENHGAVTRLGPGVRPLARVVHGVGNGAGGHLEGARRGRIVGTYMHGPALARNPALADLLLTWATGRALEPLEDTEEEALRAQRLAVVRSTGHGTRPAIAGEALARVRARVQTRRA